MLLNYLLCLYLSIPIYSVDCNKNRININIPTAEEEAQYVWSNLRDVKFFEEHNYDVSWPEGKLMESLKAKAKTGSLSDMDFEQLSQFMASSVYDKKDYEKGYQKIEERRKLINKMVNQLRKSKRNWNFKEYDAYEVNLTLYGPGGSYNSETGLIIILTTTEGGFKQDPNPANTLIHEIVHIGIEESIINQYQVSHPLKERIVDLYVLLNFKKLLPQYRLQNMGDQRIDPYLSRKKDLKRLDKIVESFLKKK